MQNLVHCVGEEGRNAGAVDEMHLEDVDPEVERADQQNKSPDERMVPKRNEKNSVNKSMNGGVQQLPLQAADFAVINPVGLKRIIRDEMSENQPQVKEHGLNVF